MNTRKYSDEQFIKAVEKSYSIAGVLRYLELRPTGANYASFNMNVKRLNCSVIHFSGKGHLKGKQHNWGKGISLEETLVSNGKHFIGNSNKLKLKLLKFGLLVENCCECKITHWRNKKLSLHLDHINGNNVDNRLENLRLLCPNCHSLTSTYAGRNKKKR